MFKNVKQIKLEPLLLMWFDFNPNMDKWLHTQWSVIWNYLSIPKLQSCTAEVREQTSSFTPYIIMDVITYP